MYFAVSPKVEQKTHTQGLSACFCNHSPPDLLRSIKKILTGLERLFGHHLPPDLLQSIKKSPQGKPCGDPYVFLILLCREGVQGVLLSLSLQ